MFTVRVKFKVCGSMVLTGIIEIRYGYPEELGKRIAFIGESTETTCRIEEIEEFRAKIESEKEGGER